VVCITGAAGQIGYSLIPLVASGEVFGENQPIELRLLDIAPMTEALKGAAMEIQDCAWPLVSVKYGSDAKELFKDIDVGIFAGGFPRKEGMERKDLIAKNVAIFKEQGQILNEVAKTTTKILVVANPANTNCYILSRYATKIPKENFTCLTRLDHNRALTQLALKADVAVKNVKNVIIWGNHSSTQYPDPTHVQINDRPVDEFIKEKEFLQGELVSSVQKRGAAIISARKASSALSAAKAIRDHLRSWYFGTQEGEIVSMGVLSHNNNYGIDKELCFSFPCKCTKGFKYEIVDGFKFDEFGTSKMKTTEKELQEERADAMAV